MSSTLLLLGLLLALVGCGGSADTPRDPRGADEAPAAGTEAVDPLSGPLWLVEDIGQRGIIDSSRVTIDFEPGGRVSGRASCNRYSGSYEVDGPSLRFGEMVRTKMACPPAIMDQEDRFLRILQKVVGYELTADGALVLRGPEGSTITAREE